MTEPICQVQAIEESGRIATEAELRPKRIILTPKKMKDYVLYH